MNTKRAINIGLIGAGFMGKCHANAFRSVTGLFDLPVSVNLEFLADVNERSARDNAAKLGFSRYTDDWRKLCEDANIDVVAITAPNALHEPMVMAALDAGKAIYCEKPLSISVDSAERMTTAAEAAGVTTLVGFNFLRNPMVQLARQLIEAGRIGRIVSFKGRHGENYMADPAVPHSFRTDVHGGGALADIGSHIISLARYLLGPIHSVTARSTTIHTERPVALGSTELKPVLVDDVTHSLIEFSSGVNGTLEANWACTGRTMDLSFEVTGTDGSIHFTQERMNELNLFEAGPSSSTSGYTKIEAGPNHEPYDRFCPAAGHHLGFNDLKVIEVAQLLEAMIGGAPCGPDFREALAVQAVVESMQKSAESREWVDVALQ